MDRLHKPSENKPNKKTRDFTRTPPTPAEKLEWLVLGKIGDELIKRGLEKDLGWSATDTKI